MDASSRRNGKRAFGEGGESLAEAFLELAGLQVLRRNVRVGRREVDIVAREGNCLVCVEVRLRRGGRCGSAAESLTARKRRLMREALRLLIQRWNWRGDFRLDLVALDWSADGKSLVLQHYRGI